MSQDFKKITAFVLLALAIVLNWESWKAFSGFSVMKEEADKYAAENQKLNATKERIDRFISFAQKNPEIVDKLSFILPGSDSKPNFISLTERTALSSGILVKKINFPKDVSPSAGAAVQGAKEKKAYEEQKVDLAFSAGYPALKNFLAAIEGSLKITDVIRVEFKPASGDNTAAAGSNGTQRVYDFSMELKTYWQSPQDREKLLAFVDAADFSDFSFAKGKQFTDLISPADYGITIDRTSELNNPAPF